MAAATALPLLPVEAGSSGRAGAAAVAPALLLPPGGAGCSEGIGAGVVLGACGGVARGEEGEEALGEEGVAGRAAGAGVGTDAARCSAPSLMRKLVASSSWALLGSEKRTISGTVQGRAWGL